MLIGALAQIKKKAETKPKSLSIFSSESKLAEIYQKTGTIFAFAKKRGRSGYEMCHEFVKCRDFLHDATVATTNETSSAIYGFEFSSEKNPKLDSDMTRMVVSNHSPTAFKDGAFKNKIKSALRVLNYFEDVARIQKSTIEQVKPLRNTKYEEVYLFQSDPIWMRSTVLVSLYTFLIRLGDKELEFTNEEEFLKETGELWKSTKGNSKDNDINYLFVIGRHVHALMKNINQIAEECSNEKLKDAPISTIHNSGGVYSFCRICCPEIFSKTAKGIIK